MKPIKTDMTTKVLGAPLGWDENANGPCMGLPIVEAHGHLYSYWRLSWPERLAALFGHPLRLCVASQAHPPVYLQITRQ